MGQTPSNRENNDKESGNRAVVICSNFPQEKIEAIREYTLAHMADLNVIAIFHFFTNLPTAANLQRAPAEALMKNFHALTAFVLYPEKDQIGLRILFKLHGKLETRQRTINVSEGTPLNEALGNIIRSAMAIILEEEEQNTVFTGAEPQTDPRPASPDADTPQSAQEAVAHRLHVGAGVGLGFFSKGKAPWVGLETHLGWQPFKTLSFHLGYTFFSRVDGEAGDVRLQVIATRSALE